MLLLNLPGNKRFDYNKGWSWVFSQPWNLLSKMKTKWREKWMIPFSSTSTTREVAVEYNQLAHKLTQMGSTAPINERWFYFQNSWINRNLKIAHLHTNCLQVNAKRALYASSCELKCLIGGTGRGGFASPEKLKSDQGHLGGGPKSGIPRTWISTYNWSSNNTTQMDRRHQIGDYLPSTISEDITVELPQVDVFMEMKTFQLEKKH